jgi:drug/metabolite transporter (DMT)-like permease
LLICVAGTLALWPFAQPMQIQTLTTTELLLLIFCGLNTVIAYGSFGLAMSYWESSRVSAILPITPLLTLLFTFALGYWQLADIPREPVDGLSVLGAVLVVTGAAAAALSRARQ